MPTPIGSYHSRFLPKGGTGSRSARSKQAGHIRALRREMGSKRAKTHLKHSYTKHVSAIQKRALSTGGTSSKTVSGPGAHRVITVSPALKAKKRIGQKKLIHSTNVGATAAGRLKRGVKKQLSSVSHLIMSPRY